MNIIVCIKQVPETGNIKIDPETHTLIRSGVPSIVNPMDLYAIEEALRWKEKLDASITVMTMGPPQAQEALKEAISMGIDRGILLSDKKFAGADTYAASYTLSLAIRKLAPYGLIFCGKQAIDGDTAQVGPGIAEHLNIPHIAYVRKIEEIDSRKVGRVPEETELNDRLMKILENSFRGVGNNVYVISGSGKKKLNRQ